MSMQPYQPTHVVPAPGVRAWSTPDAAVAPVDTLGPGLEVQIVQWWGGWAQVQCSNGWMCWVDGKVLQPVGAPAPSAAPYAPAPAYAAAPGYAAAPAAAGGLQVVAPFAILAGGLVGLSTFLPWFTFAGVDLNAFHIPLEFLTSIDSPATDDAQVNSIGGLVVVIGLAIVATTFVRSKNARRIAGAVAALVCLDYFIEVLRSLSDTPDAPGVFSVLGFGVYVTVVGAAIAIADFGRR